MLELTPQLLGPSVNTNQGIIGESVDLTLAHLADMRSSTILFRLAQHLLYKKYRDPGDEPKLHLFGQLKRVTRQWIDGGYLKCTGGTYPAQVLYHGIADMAAERIKAAITETLQGERPVKAILDAYNPTGSTAFVNFTTSKELRWQTAPNRSHVKWVVCDSEWEAEFARVAESHPRVLSYVKNQGLGLEVPYLMGSTPRKYLPDFIVQIDDGCITVEGQPDPLNLIVEVKGYRGEDAKDKANTMMVATRSDPAVQALDADASNDSRAAVFAAAFARRAIIDWEGVGDESSTAIAVSPERIDALLSLWPIFEAFNLQKRQPRHAAGRRKKRLCALADWHLSGGDSYCEACKTQCQDCPAKLNQPISHDGWQVWDLVGRLGGQMRVVGKAVLGWDMGAALAIAHALGLNPTVVAELLPELEAVMVRRSNEKLTASD